MSICRSLLLRAMVVAASVVSPCFAQPALSWRSAEWANQFPYERGEIHPESESLFRLDETFEREVKPFGGVSPQAANFWRTCVISHFAAKRGFAGWAFAEGPNAKMESLASTMYFVLGNAAADVPEKLRSSFFPVSNFQPLCKQFMKAEYYWWK